MASQYFADNRNDEEQAKPQAFDSLADRMTYRVRSHVVGVVGEFLGTFMFLFFAFTGTSTANSPATTSGDRSTDLPQGPNPQTILYISLSFGVALAITVWVFFRVSGGQFNPAVTLGLCMVGAVSWTRGFMIVPAQLAGAILAACAVNWLLPGPLAVTTYLAGDTSVGQGLFLEALLTAQLVFTVMMLAAERHKSTFLAPIGIGMSLFAAELAGVYYTGGSLNPARSFGPCVATASFRGEHWIYWAGPTLGAIVAAILFKFLKSMKYDSANPGQDLDKQELNAKILDEKLENIQRPLFNVATMVEQQNSNWEPPVKHSWDTATKDPWDTTPIKDSISEEGSPSARNTFETMRPGMYPGRKVKINEPSLAPDEIPPVPPTPTPAWSNVPPTPTQTWSNIHPPPAPAFRPRPCSSCGGH